MPGPQGPKTVKGAQSDPNYVSRLLLDCVLVFHKIITLPSYFTVPDRSILIIPKSGLGAVANVYRRAKNYSYATA